MVALADPDGPFKIRATSGDYEHEWLFRMGVWEGPVLVQVMEWAGIFLNRAQYKFSPEFLPDERTAHRFYTREVAEIHRALLKEKGIDSEIVPIGAK